MSDLQNLAGKDAMILDLLESQMIKNSLTFFGQILIQINFIS